MLKKNKYLTVFAVLFLIFGGVILFNRSILIFPGDSYEQMFQFYLGGWEKFRSLDFSQYEWSLGLGAPFIDYVYYFATNPFFYLTLLFPKELIKYSFLYLDMLKLFLVYLCCHLWLKNKFRHPETVIITSLMITFSGWMFFYLAYNLFLDSFLFYPLILYSTDRYLNQGKYGLLVGLTGILGIVNYYMLYMFIPFLLMYALFTYIQIHRDHLVMKNLFKDGFRYTVLVLAGVLLSAFILIPTAHVISGNSRFGSDSLSLFAHIRIADAFKYISSLFVPVTSRLDPNALISSQHHSFLGWGGGAPLYCTALVPVCLILLFSLKDKTERNRYLVFLSGLIFMSCFFFFYRLFQFSIDTRWFYMYVLLFALICGTVLEAVYNKEISGKAITVAAAVSILVYLLLVAVSLCFGLSAMDGKKMLILAFQLVLLIVVPLLMKYRIRYLQLVVAVDIVVSGILFLACNVPLNQGYFYHDIYDHEAVDYIKEKDDSFYRILYDGYPYHVDQDPDIINRELITANDPFAYNYNGVSFYSTLYNTAQEDFLNRYKSTWSMPNIKDRVESYSMIGAKYWFSYNENPQPPFGFEKIYSNQDYSVYENQYYVNLGFSYSDRISSRQTDPLSYLIQDQIMLDQMIVDDPSVSDTGISTGLESLGFIPVTNFASGEITLDQPVSDSLFYIENFGTPDLNVKLYSDDELVYENSFWQYNYIDIPVTDFEFNRISVSSDSFTDDYYEIYLSRKKTDLYTDWYQRIRESMFHDVEYTDDYIRGQLSLKKDINHVFTQIPYEDGWTVTVNGKRIETYKANMGFIGFDLPSGDYTVEFSYSTPGLKTGLIISAGTLIVLVIFSLLKKKHQSGTKI